MSRIELDDQILDHPKFVRAVKMAGSDAVFLWLGLRSYCAKLLTDGFIPDDMIEDVRGPKEPDARSTALSALKDSGLVEESDGGVRLHDYLDWAQSRDQVLAWRKANAERKARSRARVTVGVTRESRCDKPNVTVGVTRESQRSHTGCHGGSHSGVPEPSPSPSPSPSDSFGMKCQSKDLSESARACDMSAPRQHTTTAEPNGGEAEIASPVRQESTKSSVLQNQAQREPPDPRGALGSELGALPTREARNRTELADLPIGELAKRWRANPTWVAESSPQTRPELTEVALAWDTAVGLRPTPLGHAGRDPCTKALLELYADGVPQSALLRACEQAGRTDWICGRAPDFKQQMRKRRISTLNMGVFRDLLDAAPPIGVSRVSPAVAALLAERRKETA